MGCCGGRGLGLGFNLLRSAAQGGRQKRAANQRL